MTEQKPTGVIGKLRGLYAVPDYDVPSTRRCIQIMIPDDIAAVRQLFGALYELTRWQNYQRESTHKATEWAKAWKIALSDSLPEGNCMTTQIRVDDICTLSWSYDDWVTFDSYDPSACILANIDGYVPGLINDIIDGLIADGTLQRGGGQPGPAEPPIVGTCQNYHVVLRASDRWKIPSPISEGDTITVSNVHGGWTDGAFAWYCYDGSAYVLGACTGDAPYEETDPIQSGNHMRLILGYNTSSPTYGDVLGSSFIVPEGVSSEEAWFQANDSPIDDNNGQIEFDVEVCTAGWCQRFDFTVDDYGWLGTYGEVYSAGNGWPHGATYVDSVYIYSPLFDEGSITAVTVEISTPMSGGRNLWRFKLNGTNADTSPNYNVADGAADEKTWTTTPLSATRIAVGIEKSIGNTPSYDGYITAITLHGTGISPFGADNC